MSDQKVVLLSRTQTVVEDSSLSELVDSEGNRHILFGRGRTIASENTDEWGRIARLLATLRVEKLDEADILRSQLDIGLLGGGLNLLPRLLGPTHRITVFEIEDVLARYAPHYVGLVLGDWRDTLQALYDVLIFDTGEDPDIPRLLSHLKPEGILITGPNAVTRQNDAPR